MPIDLDVEQCASLTKWELLEEPKERVNSRDGGVVNGGGGGGGGGSLFVGEGAVPRLEQLTFAVERHF